MEQGHVCLSTGHDRLPQLLSLCKNTLDEYLFQLRSNGIYYVCKRMNMDKKLTVSLNQRVIEKAKKYARLHRGHLY